MNQLVCRGVWIGVFGLMAACGGCVSASRSSDAPLVAPDYSTSFETAKQVLLDYRFQLDRIDARHGVITTQEKPTAGIASPWDREQSTLTQEAEELINQELRRVRVEFTTDGTAAASSQDGKPVLSLTPVNTPEADLTDLRTLGQPVRIEITVQVLRVHRPGRQPSTMSIRSSTNYVDPDLVKRGIAPVADEDLGRDEALESRLMNELERRLAQPTGR